MQSPEDALPSRVQAQAARPGEHKQSRWCIPAPSRQSPPSSHTLRLVSSLLMGQAQPPFQGSLGPHPLEGWSVLKAWVCISICGFRRHGGSFNSANDSRVSGATSLPAVAALGNPLRSTNHCGPSSVLVLGKPAALRLRLLPAPPASGRPSNITSFRRWGESL